MGRSVRVFASVSVVRVNQLKTEFHTAQKGADSVDKYLIRLKAIKVQILLSKAVGIFGS